METPKARQKIQMHQKGMHGATTEDWTMTIYYCFYYYIIIVTITEHLLFWHTVLKAT